MTLDIGAGPHSMAEVQVDQVWFPKTTHVFDIVNVPWPFEDETFDEVRAEQVLEHIPSSIYFKDPFDAFKHVYPRVQIMKEIYRVLKRGGIAHISVPVEQKEFNQDPTHTGPMIDEGFFSYFCGEWGANTPGDFATDGYGINFSFEKAELYRTGFILTARLRKN